MKKMVIFEEDELYDIMIKLRDRLCNSMYVEHSDAFSDDFDGAVERLLNIKL